MTEKKRQVSLLIVILSVLVMAGCNGKGSGKYTYRLEYIEHWDYLYVTQTVYYDDRVEIELDGEYSNNELRISTPDDDEAETEHKSNKLIIYSDDPAGINSVNIGNSWYEVKFRYLDTGEYACIWRFFADDLGWDEYTGDTDKYYTDEEKEQQREAEEKARELREKAQKEDEELFAVFQGKWVSEDGDHFDIYEGGQGHAVAYYRSDTQTTEEYQGFMFSLYMDDTYRVRYEENGWGVSITYYIDYSGGDHFLYSGKEFTRLNEEEEKQKSKRTREYFENLDKESSLDKIVEELGPYGVRGSGIIYFVWQLNDGSEAELVFDSNGKIEFIYIVTDGNSERIYDRDNTFDR